MVTRSKCKEWGDAAGLQSVPQWSLALFIAALAVVAAYNAVQVVEHGRCEWVGAQKMTRIAGRSARGTMATWVKLRSERPELFELVDVAQQPAAVMDAILSSWVVEQQGRTQ